MKAPLFGVAIAALCFAGVAVANPPAPAEGHEEAPAAHGEAPVGHEEGVGHDAAAAGAEGAHAEGEGHHAVSYTGDDDHDGTANWMDGDSVDAKGKSVPTRLGQHFYNFLILFGILGFALRQPLSDAIKNRASLIRKELTETARARDEARQRFDELNARLGAFEDEVQRLRADAETDAKAEERKLIERANAEAARLTKNAERNIRDELVRARVALQEDAVSLAVKLAEQTLKSQVQSEDQRRLARQFLDSLNQQEVGHG